MHFETAIFDMDDTLVKISPTYEFNWTKHCFESFTDSRVSDKLVQTYLNTPIPNRKPILDKLGFESIRQYLDMWLTPEALKAREDSLHIYDDTTVILELKAQGLKLGLVTAAPKQLGEMQVRLLEKQVGASQLFHQIVYIQGSQFSQKPNPRSLQYCMAQLGAKSETTFYCGDLEDDLQMAKNAKVTPIHINRMSTTQPFKNVRTIYSLSELITN